MNDNLEKVRHSSAHLLAHAISDLFPGTKFAIGPATATGFFYDFLPQKNLTNENLKAIEKKMHEIVDRDFKILQKEVDKEAARKIFKDNPFKLELIDQILGNTVGLSEQGDFIDLCEGGHVESTGKLKHFKLTGISGSYWRGDRKKPALQRISGVAFLSAKDLRIYEKKREEAFKHDHRKLGKELDLFSFHKEGTGFPFFHPKGQIVLNELTSFMRKLLEKNNYQEISTPIILNEDLWKRSGHYAHYKENMYFLKIDDVPHAIKPMNCPGAFLIYNTRPRSYRELPMRLSEMGRVHRHELSGVLHGLLRVRAFTQDDAHCFCTYDQLEKEIKNILQLTFIVMSKVGFEKLHISLATKPEDAIGGEEKWNRAIDALKNTLESGGHKYKIKKGEGAFYGPKIEVGVEDSMGRHWQCGTIQVDFFQPENFNLRYVAPSGKKEQVVVVHHVIYGSLERFFAVLLEHHKGRLPFWLAPEQVRILTITDKEMPYGEKILKKLKIVSVRATIDKSNDPISGKIKLAQTDRIPWMLIVGAKEVENKTVTLRLPDGKQQFGLSVNEILIKATELILK